MARILRSSFTSGLWLIFLLVALSLFFFHPASGGGRATLCGNVPPHPPPSRVYFANAKNVLLNSYQLPYSSSERRLFKWNFEFHDLLLVTFLYIHTQCHGTNNRDGSTVGAKIPWQYKSCCQQVVAFCSGNKISRKDINSERD